MALTSLERAANSAQVTINSSFNFSIFVFNSLCSSFNSSSAAEYRCSNSYAHFNENDIGK
jgi:hypothetical protein